jgi:hypothetical protein
VGLPHLKKAEPFLTARLRIWEHMLMSTEYLRTLLCTRDLKLPLTRQRRRSTVVCIQECQVPALTLLPPPVLSAHIDWLMPFSNQCTLSDSPHNYRISLRFPSFPFTIAGMSAPSARRRRDETHNYPPSSVCQLHDRPTAQRLIGQWHQTFPIGEYAPDNARWDDAMWRRATRRRR